MSDEKMHQFGIVVDPPLPFECFDPKFFDEEICDGCIEYDDCKRIRKGELENDDTVSNNDAQNSSDND